MDRHVRVEGTIERERERTHDGALNSAMVNPPQYVVDGPGSFSLDTVSAASVKKTVRPRATPSAASDRDIRSMEESIRVIGAPVPLKPLGVPPT